MKNSLNRYAKYTLGLFALIFALSPVLSSDESTFINTAMAQESRTPPGIELTQDHPLIHAAMGVQDRHTTRLMNIQGVVGTGIGLGVDGLPVIKIYTVRAGIPDIPVDLEGIPAQVEVTGMIVALTDPTARQPRPVPIGVSTGHPDITAGTIGARVIKTDSDGNITYYALSNNHVFANSNDARATINDGVGDSVIQPGDFDGGSSPADNIGSLADFEPINFSGGENIMDAAIAHSTTDMLGNSTPSNGYGTPSSTPVDAVISTPPQAVQKYGRTTAWTQGTVDGISVNVDVCYEQQCRGPFNCTCTTVARFVDQIAIIDGDFSAGGDSGSLIVDMSNHPVGLLFAGSNTHTFANPIGPVLKHFDVTIDSTPPEPVTPVTDLAITSVVANPTSVTQGDTVTVDVTVTNTGNQKVEGDISVVLTDTDDTTSIEIGTEIISGGLSAGAATTLTFFWDTADCSLVDHTLSAVHNLTDDVSSNDTSSTTVAVNEPGTAPTIDLSATGYKVQGRQKVDLNWSGATSEYVDIKRDGTQIDTTSETSFTDHINRRGGGSYTYQVCETDSTTTCSNEVTVVF
ncbi:hypothetical protein C942_04162 [Photobacterium marinum]|uniref:CARDB domain-containing protein n=1 Tax=Photobacterium marinum TaxID=1056511 RepID=L8JG18_9GAMM|nr:CARDB domain-containing protein [Photobacterium marinum]ELR66464.1 hypothetical protein C942_04162 [Photobacterium marinum]